MTYFKWQVVCFLVVCPFGIQAQEWLEKDRPLALRDPFRWLEVKEKDSDKEIDLPVLKKEKKKKKTIKKKEVIEKIVAFPWVLKGISMSAGKPCALLLQKGRTIVAMQHDELGKGWSVEQIDSMSVVCKHRSGERKELLL